MSFNSPLFLFLFLPISVISYYLTPRKLKHIFILLISLFFYSWADLRVLFVMTTLIFGNWAIVKCFRVKEARTFLFIVGIVTNISLLFFYKYLSPSLPLGFSFFVFHSLSYLIDSFKGDLKDSSLGRLGIYSLYFPHVSAGPISRATDFITDLKNLKPSVRQVFDGVTLFVIGLGQKMLLANTFAMVAGQIFSDLSSLYFASAWLGIFMYTLQIYFDFAGYSNMAIGLSKMLGLDIPINFNLPYIAKSITEFWTRWHISLTTWLRQYVYFSLGGSRKGVVRTYLNIFLVFIVSGLWHGTGYTFVAWGLWHGMFMVLERYIKNQSLNLSLPSIFGHLYTMLVVMFGWVLFRAESMTFAIAYLKVLLGLGKYDATSIHWMSYLSPYVIFACILGVGCSLGLSRMVLANRYIKFFVLPIVFVLSLLAVAGSTYSSFIYTKF